MLSSIAENTTIVALSTAQGVGAIGVIRLSGPKAIEICNKVFKGKDLLKQASHTLHFGKIADEKRVLDEVVVSLFVAPSSYTGENTVEISCHGSPYILKSIIELLIKNGATAANPGEFTLRAFLNGKLDLTQAEAVGDLIASNSESAHKIAMNQMRGGISNEIKRLREELIHFASMIELELDFSEEDVEFANRDELKDLIIKVQKVLHQLIETFALGNAIKEGIPVVIAGKPNAGKSTLLNTLLNEERALVTEIEGTTRDSIEDELNIGGTIFRFIDTAGIRQTEDVVEALGVKRTLEKIESAAIVLLIVDLNNTTPALLKETIVEINDSLQKNKAKLVIIGNKVDLKNLAEAKAQFAEFENLHFISAKEKWNIEELKESLKETAQLHTLNQDETLVSNTRHWEALTKANVALQTALTGIDNGLTGDFIAMDIRASLHQLGLITGEITTDDLLGNIFSKFCIGK
jgi:tRNA modification GTPase